MKEWNIIIGQRLRERREQKGWSLRKLALKVECDFGHIGKIENGQACPSSHLLFRLGRALGCDMGYFYAPIRSAMNARF